MQDLNASMFYKAKFNIRTANGDPDDLLWRLVLNIRNWITHKWNPWGKPTVIEYRMGSWSHFKKGGKFYDLEHLNRIYAESVYHQVDDDPSTVSWACKIVEKPEAENGCAPREWITEIGYRAISSNSAEISYVVTYSDMAGFIGFCMPAPSPSVPRVVRTILEDPELICSVGPNAVSLTATKLNPGDYPVFEAALLDPAREVPLIYISPRRLEEDSDEAQVLIDPTKVACSVACNALVYYADSLDYTREMNYMGNSNYLCSGGAIRVYRPNVKVDDESDPSRHRFLSARFIEEHGEEKVIDLFRRAMAQDVHFYESLFRMDDCRALVEADLHRARIARIRAQSQGEADEATAAFLEESDKREAAERANRTLQDENDRLKTENYNLGVQVEMYRDRANQVGRIEAATRQVRSIAEYPNTPQAIARYFETVYPERIAFTERAYRSMDECETKSEVLWEVFYHIATDLFGLVKSNPAQAYTEFKNKTGWDIGRGEGSQTHADSKLMRQYVDTYDGQEIDIEAHIKNGVRESDPKFVRIYFAYDPSVADKIIIGHCGKHLDNYSTRKARK